MVKNLLGGPRWIPTSIIEQFGPVSYLMDMFDGRIWKCHIYNIKDNPKSILPELTK